MYGWMDNNHACELQRIRKHEIIHVKDQLYTKNPEIVTIKTKYEKRTTFEKWIKRALIRLI